MYVSSGIAKTLNSWEQVEDSKLDYEPVQTHASAGDTEVDQMAEYGRLIYSMIYRDLSSNGFALAK
jgi:hypothetical protein